MGKFIKVASKKDIPSGKMKAFNVVDREITIVNIDGEFLAFDDTCTHAQCSLAGGYLEGNTVTCYCHGAQFDVKSGKVLAPPASSPLSVYKVKVEGKEIFIKI